MFVLIFLLSIYQPGFKAVYQKHFSIKICIFDIMERLIIEVPEQKSNLVKQILTGLGVIIKQDNKDISTYKQKISGISVWTDEDIKSVEEGKNAFTFKSTEW